MNEIDVNYQSFDEFLENLSDSEIMAIISERETLKSDINVIQENLAEVRTRAIESNEKYYGKMVRSTSVHSQKRELKVNDKVLVKKDFDNNKSTRKDFFGVEFEPKGIVVGFSKNGLVQVKLDHDNEIKRFKINMLKLDE